MTTAIKSAISAFAQPKAGSTTQTSNPPSCDEKLASVLAFWHFRRTFVSCCRVSTFPADRACSEISG